MLQWVNHTIFIIKGKALKSKPHKLIIRVIIPYHIHVISGLNIPFWRATRLNNRKKSNISIVSNIFTCKAYHSTCMKVVFEIFCLNGSKRGIYPEKVNIFGSRLPPCETYIIFPAHCTVVHVINSITWKMLNRHEASI